jgi:hypothetical protein
MEASSARRCSPKVTAAEHHEDADLLSPNALLRVRDSVLGFFLTTVRTTDGQSNA